MLRILIAVLLLSLTPASAFADQPRPSKYVDLNVPGAMEKLRVSNSLHYEKVQRIIDGLSSRGYEEIPRWIRTSFNAKDVYYSNILLTTSPPQRDLSFVLDDTQYRGRVTLDRSGAQVFPIRNP